MLDLYPPFRMTRLKPLRLVAALGLGLRLWLAGLVFWLVGHGVAVWAAKRDPLFVDVVRRHLRIPAHLSV